jgi:hypothetical protein
VNITSMSESRSRSESPILPSEVLSIISSMVQSKDVVGKWVFAVCEWRLKKDHMDGRAMVKPAEVLKTKRGCYERSSSTYFIWYSESSRIMGRVKG